MHYSVRIIYWLYLRDVIHLLTAIVSLDIVLISAWQNVHTHIVELSLKGIIIINSVVCSTSSSSFAFLINFRCANRTNWNSHYVPMLGY